MKANELMIGDYVQVNDEAYKVISILYFDIGISDGKKDFYHEHIDNIKPIPITEDILDKNFKDIAEPHQRIYGGRWVYFDNCFEVDIHIYKNGVCAITVEDLHLAPCWNMFARYVHELQHAFRLCGIEKEIEL